MEMKIDKFRKAQIEAWQKKHRALMDNLTDDEVFFPIYDQRNKITGYNFHKLVRDLPDDLEYTGTGELYGDAATFFFSRSTKQAYMRHRLIHGCLSAKYRTVMEKDTA